MGLPWGLVPWEVRFPSDLGSYLFPGDPFKVLGERKEDRNTTPAFILLPIPLLLHAFLFLYIMRGGLDGPKVARRVTFQRRRC